MESLTVEPMAQLLRASTWLDTLATLVVTLLVGRWYLRTRLPAVGIFALALSLHLLAGVVGHVWELVSFAQIRALQPDMAAQMRRLNAVGTAVLLFERALDLVSLLLVALGVGRVARR